MIIKTLSTFGLIAALSLVPTFTRAAEIPSDEYFRIDTITKGLKDPMGIAVAPSGEIYLIERKGELKVIQPTSGDTVTIATLPLPLIFTIHLLAQKLTSYHGLQ